MCLVTQFLGKCYFPFKPVFRPFSTLTGNSSLSAPAKLSIYRFLICVRYAQNAQDLTRGLHASTRVASRTLPKLAAGVFWVLQKKNLLLHYELRAKPLGRVTALRLNKQSVVLGPHPGWNAERLRIRRWLSHLLSLLLLMSPVLFLVVVVILAANSWVSAMTGSWVVFVGGWWLKPA